MVRKADLGSHADHATNLNQSSGIASLDATINRNDLGEIVEELRRPFSAAERDLRDEMILRDLEPDDDLRAYVYRNHGTPIHTAPNPAPEDGPIESGQISPAERTLDITDQDSSEIDWSDRPQRSKVST